MVTLVKFIHLHLSRRTLRVLVARRVLVALALALSMQTVFVGYPSLYCCINTKKQGIICVLTGLCKLPSNATNHSLPVVQRVEVIVED